MRRTVAVESKSNRSCNYHHRVTVPFSIMSVGGCHMRDYKAPPVVIYTSAAIWRVSVSVRSPFLLPKLSWIDGPATTSVRSTICKLVRTPRRLHAQRSRFDKMVERGAVLSECARGMDLETERSARRRQENDEDTADNLALGAIRRESKPERRRLSIDRRRREARGGGVSDDGGAG